MQEAAGERMLNRSDLWCQTKHRSMDVCMETRTGKGMHGWLDRQTERYRQIGQQSAEKCELSHTHTHTSCRSYIMKMMWISVKLTLQMVLYNSQLQLACNSMLGAKPGHNLANVRTESITRSEHLIPLPLILTPKRNREIWSQYRRHIWFRWSWGNGNNKISIGISRLYLL